jgi:hypothetical protein
LDDIDTEESLKKKQDIIDKDKEKAKHVDSFTQELIKGLEGIKKLDEIYAKLEPNKYIKEAKYVEREEDPELKKMFEDE